MVIGDRPIGSPIIKNPLHLVAMNRPSLEKFAPVIKPKGVILINTSLISIDSGRSDIDELKVPAVEIAGNIGNSKVANIVALSAFVAYTRVVSMEALIACIKDEFAKKSRKVIDLNLKAVDAGVQAAGR